MILPPGTVLFYAVEPAPTPQAGTGIAPPSPPSPPALPPQIDDCIPPLTRQPDGSCGLSPLPAPGDCTTAAPGTHVWTPYLSCTEQELTAIPDVTTQLDGYARSHGYQPLTPTQTFCSNDVSAVLAWLKQLVTQAQIFCGSPVTSP